MKLLTLWERSADLQKEENVIGWVVEFVDWVILVERFRIENLEKLNRGSFGTVVLSLTK